MNQKNIILRVTNQLTGLFRILMGGGDDDFSLQARIYHSACLVTIVVMTYVLLFDLLNGLMVNFLAILCALPFHIFLFYLSRYRGKTILSFNIYAILSHIFFIWNYSNNGGMSGSTILSFLSVYFMMLVVYPRRHYLVITILNFSVVAGLIMTEFYIPDYVNYTSLTKKQHMIDEISTYAVTMILLFAAIAYIITNYENEREKVEEWASELDRLYEEKSRLIEIISHDYHTPLVNIRRYLEMTQRLEPGIDVRRSLEADLITTLASTQNMLQNLLEPAKKRNSSTELVETFTVVDVLNPILEVYEDIAKGKRIKLSVHIPQTLEITALKISFSVIVRNLVNNAIKYTPESGWINLNYKTENGRDVFSISNSGYISDPSIQIMIKRYLKNELDQIPTVGLSIIRQHASAMSAIVQVQSTYEEGTIFSLSIEKV